MCVGIRLAVLFKHPLHVFPSFQALQDEMLHLNLKFMSLANGAFNTKEKKNKAVLLTLHEKEKEVRRFIPKYPSNRGGKNYWKYCKYQLIRYKPFRSLDDILTDDDTPEVIIDKWKTFLNTDKGKSQIFDWSEHLDNATTVLKAIEKGEEIECDLLKVDEELSWYKDVVKPKMIDEDVLNVERNPEKWKKHNLKYSAKTLSEIDILLQNHSLNNLGNLFTQNK